jgi:hypothetical protein
MYKYIHLIVEHFFSLSLIVELFFETSLIVELNLCIIVQNLCYLYTIKLAPLVP